MYFISNGDFIFPFNWHMYWAQHFYTWSFQRGAANPDGTIRFAGRILYMLVFALFGNLGVSYFYILFSLAVVFISFYVFAKYFLGIGSRYAQLFGALFFTINPIFLGNISKIGLIFAASMLPLSLTVLKLAFAKNRPRYLLLWIVFLNLSLIHPFTFTLNIVVSGAYAFYLAWNKSSFIRHNLIKLLGIGALAILINMYFILPLGSMHTIDKGALSNDVTSAPIDYTALVDIANTGTLLTGFSLSKNVLKDYDFYNGLYAVVYFAGVFALYIILILIYQKVATRLTSSDRKYLAWFFGAFLLLLALSTAVVFHVDTVVKFLIGLPGGWTFRSPLKWQLYIPLVLFAIMVILLQALKTKRSRVVAYIGVAIVFVLLNGYIMTDVYKKLLVPRSVTYFQQLAQLPLDHRSVLFVSSSDCIDFARQNPRALTELNQIFVSQNVQLKQVSLVDIDMINLSDYNYVLGCRDTLAPTFTSNYNFTQQATFVGGAFRLYKNHAAPVYAVAVPNVFSIVQPEHAGERAGFVQQAFGQHYYATDKPLATPSVGLNGIFEDLMPSDISEHTVSQTIIVPKSGQQAIYVNETKPLLYYTAENGKVTFTTAPQLGARQLTTNLSLSKITLTARKGQKLNFSYTDTQYNKQNLIPDNSLEQGPWQKAVSDCNDYDNNPQIAMAVNRQAKTDGKQSLQLSATRHTACTGPADIPVSPGGHYLISFDYQNVQGEPAGYFIGFNNSSQRPISGRLATDNIGWHTFTQSFVVPNDTQSVHLSVYAFPDSNGTITRYDNFQLYALPDIQNKFYLVSGTPHDNKNIPQVTTTVVNPTKNIIHITSATKPFYLVVKDSYSSQWQLEPMKPAAHGGVSSSAHTKLNGSLNGWYIDPAAVCKATAACHQPSGGGYSFDVAMEFKPQHWFYLGLLLSGIGVLGSVGYFIGESRHERNHSIARVVHRK